MGKSKKQRQKRELLLAELEAGAELLRERTAAFTDELERGRSALNDARAVQQALELELEQGRSALNDARAAQHALELGLEREARASLADVTSRSVQSLAAFEASLVGLRDRAAMRVDEQAESCGALVADGSAVILAAVERDAREATDDARRRINDAVAIVEQLSADAERAFATIPPEPEPEPDEEPPASTFTVEEEFLVSPPPVDEALFPTRAPSGTAAGTATATATTTRITSVPVAARATRRPVQARVPLAALAASTAVLARYAADERVRVEVVHLAVSGRSESFLRLTAYNVAGWWEYHDVPAQTDCNEPQCAVVELGEFANALEFAREQSDEPDVVVHMTGDLTIGNVLLLDHPGTDPVLPYHRQRIERVDLGAADRAGLEVETQVGRMFVPPRLISFLKSRNYRSSELLMVEEWPCLAAEISSSAEGTSAVIVSRLRTGDATLDESSEERRNAAGSEVEQLVRALSADTTVEQLEQILRTGVGYARRRAAAHPALPPSVIHDLLDVGTETIRAAAASNPSISEAACSLAATDRSEIVRAAIAENRAATAECLALLAFDPATQVRERAASNLRCTRELLARLAEDPDSAVRAAAAANPEQDPDALDLLAHDADPRVCAAVASNPACPEPLLQELLSLVPDTVLANPGAPASVLAAGSRVDARQLRTVVAANPATPVKQLQALARDSDPDVVRAVAENPATPANVRRRARRRLTG